MAFIPSNWTIVFAPGTASEITLLTTSQELDDELALPWTADVDSSKPLRGASAKRYARGRVATDFSFIVYHTHSTHAEARNFMLSRVASLPTGVTANLRITVLGGNSYQLSTAVLIGGEQRMVVGGGVIRTRHEYKITGGRFSAI